MKVGSRAKPKAPPMEAGVYIGVCIGVVDLGEQETVWKGKTRYANKVKIIFEIPSETIDVDGEERPRQLSRDFTVSTSSKGKLRQFVDAWLGRHMTDGEFSEFELFDLLGRSGQLNVVQSDDGQYADIGAIIGLPKGMPAPKAKSEHITFDTDEWDDETFDALPEYLQERLKKSTQYKNRHLPDQEVSVKAADLEAAEDAGDGEECPF